MRAALVIENGSNIGRTSRCKREVTIFDIRIKIIEVMTSKVRTFTLFLL